MSRRVRRDHSPGNRSRGKMCAVTGKECRTEREANKMPRHFSTMSAYRCGHCGQWHVGKNNYTAERRKEWHPVLGLVVIKKFA